MNKSDLDILRRLEFLKTNYPVEGSVSPQPREEQPERIAPLERTTRSATNMNPTS